MARIALVPTLPSEAEAALAKETSRVLATRKTPEPLRLGLLDDPLNTTITLPASVVMMLARILEEMGRGNAVTFDSGSCRVNHLRGSRHAKYFQAFAD